MKRRSRRIVVAVVVLFLLVCGSNVRFAFAESKGAVKADVKKAVVKAVVKAVEPADYHYNPVGKPDPFKPFVSKELLARKKATKAPIPSIFPLQRAGIDQFNLVGIVGNADCKVAIMETKDGKGRYPLSIGTLVGLNKGKVVEIRKDRIIIEEKGSTGKKTNRITKKLRRDEEEGLP